MQECEGKILNSVRRVLEVLDGAVKFCGATEVGKISHQFFPQGVSIVVAIEESHISIHTWPEHGTAAVDIFTCGDTIDPHKAVSVIVTGLGCRRAAIMEIERRPEGSRVVSQETYLEEE